MALLKALHAIRHVPPGGEKIVPVAPGTIFEANDGDIAFLKRTEAAEDPSASELALHKLANGGYVEAPAPAPTPEPKDAGKDSKAAGGDAGKSGDDQIG